MPIIQVNLLEGRTVEQKRELAKLITEAAVKALGSKPESVRVMMHEMGAEDFAVGGVTMMDSRAGAAAAQKASSHAGNGASHPQKVAS